MLVLCYSISISFSNWIPSGGYRSVYIEAEVRRPYTPHTFGTWEMVMTLLSTRVGTHWLETEFERLDLYLRLVVLESHGGDLVNPNMNASEVEVYGLLGLECNGKDIIPQLEAELDRLATVRNAPNTGRNAEIPGRLCAAFQLSSLEWDILLAVAAPAFHEKYQRIYAWLNGFPSSVHASPGMLQRLFARNGLQRVAVTAFLSAHPAVCRFHLIGSGQDDVVNANELHACPRLVSVLCGQIGLDTKLTGCLIPVSGSRVHDNLQPLQLKPIIDNIIGELRYQQNGVSFRFHLHGSRGSGRRSSAQVIAEALNFRVVELDLQTLLGRGQDFYSLLQRVFKELLLTGAIPLINHLTALQDDDSSKAAMRAHLLRTLNSTFPFVFILLDETCNMPLDEAIETETHTAVTPLYFPFPNLQARAQVWHMALRANGLFPNQLTPLQLAAMYRFHSGRIEEAVRLARTLRIGNLASDADALILEACRGICNHKLSKLADRVPCIFSWEDLILRPKSSLRLRDLAHFFKHREALFDNWGFGQRVSQKGLHALFHGPPGTGKTMAASVIAATLKLELYRIDLSRIMSKYIGETEKNLSAIFREARDAGAILFFDEADALFGKRTEVKDANDRFANVEISYLLQQMESYEGVTILATNLLQNLDDAFTRRIKFIVELPFPEKEERKKLWMGMFPKRTPYEEDVDFQFLSERFPLSGGEIKNVVLGAAAYAMEGKSKIGMPHLIYALKLELEKKGEFFVMEDFEPYTHYAENHPIYQEKDPK